MSPLSLRRYRAERLLREEFEALRGRVIATARGRLRASGVSLDASDLEACYAQAWQGLYAAVLDGQEIANPSGWLVIVTFRRAIEEHRARGLLAGPVVGVAEERDFAAELDDRARLRQLFEALSGRLSARELQAAALCYLQGLSRSEAAARMGVSEARMRKLMEGRGAARPGVSGKVGALVETIRGGGWCEEQGSLMRGLAYGILDPEGERYRLALVHRSECPACRAYVASLRGLAAVLPPVPVLLHWALRAGAAAGTGAVARASAGAGTGAGTHAGAGVASSTAAGAGVGSGAVAPAAPGVGAAVSASGAAGASAAGGWLLVGGPVGAKLAVGCLLVLGVGAGCVALTDQPDRAPVDRRESAHAAGPRSAAAAQRTNGALLAEGDLVAGVREAQRLDASARARAASSSALNPARRASREFGPEQALAPGETRSGASAGGPAAPTARSASTGAESAASAESSARPSGAASAGAPAGAGAQAGGTSAAQREFAPG